MLPNLGGTGIQNYGGGTGTILLDDVGCTGTESRLWQCANLGIGVNNCAHSEDAGVTCTAVSKSVKIYVSQLPIDIDHIVCIMLDQHVVLWHACICILPLISC